MSTEYSEINPNYAQKAFETLRATLDAMQWKYNSDDANKTIVTSAVGEDLTINLRMVVSEERKVMYIKSLLPFEVPVAKRDEVGKALHIANFAMLNGCFEYDQYGGKIAFKMVAPFFDCELSKEVFRYVVLLTCQMVDKFNDKLLDVIHGKMTLAEFKEFAEK